jgi:hypothetical protein
MGGLRTPNEVTAPAPSFEHHTKARTKGKKVLGRLLTECLVNLQPHRAAGAKVSLGACGVLGTPQLGDQKSVCSLGAKQEVERKSNGNRTLTRHW